MAYLFYQRGYLTELRVSGIRKKFKENRLRGRQKNALLLRPFKSHLFVFFFARGDRVGHKDRRVSQLLQIDANALMREADEIRMQIEDVTRRNSSNEQTLAESMDLEQEVNEEAENLKTVGDAIKYIESKAAAKE